MKSSFIKPILVLILFGTLSFGIYSNTLEVPFYFDDNPVIIENAHIRITNLSFNAIKNAGFNSFDSSRPIGYISFAINYYFHQYNPKGYHIVNIIVHILTGLLLYLFIKTTLSIPISKSFSTLIPQSFNPAFIAFFAALIWLVNPVHTQSVTYIVQRMNSMASMFFILSLWLYAKGRMIQHLQLTSLQHDKSSKLDKNTLAIKRKTAFSFQLLIPGLYFSGAFLSWILALGCKQTAATLPFFIFLYDWYFFQDLSKDWLKRQLKYLVFIFVLFGLIAFLYLGLNPLEKITSISDYANKEFTFTERVLTQPRVVIYYLSLLFFPHPSRLNLDHDFPLSHSLVDPITTLFSFCIIFGLIGWAVYRAKKERLISFCILWFFGNLVIESSVIPLAIIYEHRTYLPSMLVCFLFIILGQRYIKLKWPGVVLFCFITAMFSFWTYQRNNIWRDPVTLWSDSVAKSPQKARPHGGLGAALEKQDRIEEAIQHYLKALRINPDYVDVHNNLGLARDKQERIEEAIQHYLQALRIMPDYEKAHYNLGVARDKQGRTKEAFQHYLQALRIKPDFAEAHNNLGNALNKQDHIEEAIEHYLSAIRIKPDFADAHYNLGVALYKQDLTEEAIRHYLQALRVKPDYEKAHNNLGLARDKQGRTKEAIRHYLQALRIKPDFAEAHNNLGNALNKQGRTEEATQHYLKALRIKPDYEKAHNNLGLARDKQGRTKEAIDHYLQALRIKPDYVEAHNNLGAVLFRKGQIEKAVEHFKMALKIAPDYGDLRINLKKALALLKEIDAVIAEIQKTLEITPYDPELYYNLGDLYYRKGDLNKAIAQYQKALSIQPESVPALNRLALMFSIQNKNDKALSLFKQIVGLHPDSAETYYNIACMYSKKQNIEEAIGWLKQAINIGYNNWDQIKTDKDLENIKGSSYYQELIKGR